jgi:hypothetical protein
MLERPPKEKETSCLLLQDLASLSPSVIVFKTNQKGGTPFTNGKQKDQKEKNIFSKSIFS